MKILAASPWGWGVLLAAYVALPFGLLVPMVSIRDEVSGELRTRSTLGAIAELGRKGYPLPCGLLFCFSVLLPALKGAACLLALRSRPWAAERLHAISKYQCVDVFVALLLLVFLSSDLLEVQLLRGYFCFLSYCLLSVAGALLLLEGPHGPLASQPALSRAAVGASTAPTVEKQAAVTSAATQRGWAPLDLWLPRLHLMAQVIGMTSALGSPMLTVRTLSDGVALQTTSLSLKQALQQALLREGGAHACLTLLALVLVAPACHAAALTLALQQPRWLRRWLWGWSMADVFAIAVGVAALSLRALGTEAALGLGAFGCAVAGASLVCASWHSGGRPSRHSAPALAVHALVLGGAVVLLAVQARAAVLRDAFGPPGQGMDPGSLSAQLEQQRPGIWRALSASMPQVLEQCRPGLGVLQHGVAAPACNESEREPLYQGSMSLGFLKGDVKVLSLGDLHSMSMEAAAVSSSGDGLELRALLRLHHAFAAVEAPMVGGVTLKQDDVAGELVVASRCSNGRLGPWNVSSAHLLTPIKAMGMFDVTDTVNQALAGVARRALDSGLRLGDRRMSFGDLAGRWLRANSEDGGWAEGEGPCPSRSGPPAAFEAARGRLSGAGGANGLEKHVSLALGQRGRGVTPGAGPPLAAAPPPPPPRKVLRASPWQLSLNVDLD